MVYNTGLHLPSKPFARLAVQPLQPSSDACLLAALFHSISTTLQVSLHHCPQAQCPTTKNHKSPRLRPTSTSIVSRGKLPVPPASIQTGGPNKREEILVVDAERLHTAGELGRCIWESPPITLLLYRRTSLSSQDWHSAGAIANRVLHGGIDRRLIASILTLLQSK